MTSDENISVSEYCTIVSDIYDEASLLPLCKEKIFWNWIIHTSSNVALDEAT